MGLNRRLSLVVAMSFAVAGILVTTSARSAEFGYALGAGVEYTDNVDLAPSNEKSDLIYILNAGYRYSQRATNLDLRVGLAGQAQIHRDETYDDEYIGAGRLELTWKPYPGFFHWVVDDTYSPTINPQTKNTPGNIEQANVLSTGPDLFFRFGAVDTLNLGARYVDTRYTDSVDSTGGEAHVRWLHRTSARSTLSLSHERQRVNYDDETEDDFSKITNTAGIAFQSAHDRFQADYGYATIDRERKDAVRTNVGSLTWDRAISGRTALNVRAVRDLGDAGTEVVRQAGNQQDPGVISVPSTTDVYLLRAASARLQWGISPGTARVSSIEVFALKRDYEIDFTNDERDGGARVEVTWPFTQLLYGTLTGSYTKKDFYSIDRRDREKVAGVGMHYVLNRRTKVGTYVRQTDNDSNEPVEVYKETRFGVFLSYAISGNRTR